MRRPLLDAAIATTLAVTVAWLAWPALGPSSLWLDDAWLALVARIDGPGELLLVSVTAPGFSGLLWVLFSAAGFSELVAQLPALAAGVAAPPLLYLTLVRRGTARHAAFVGGAVLATAPVVAVYAGRVKHYTWDVLLVVAIVAVAWDLVREPRRAWRWWLFAALGALAVAFSAGVAPVVVAAGAAAWLAALRPPAELGPGGPGPAGGRRIPLTAPLASAAWLLAAGGWYLAVIGPGTTRGLNDAWTSHFVRLDGVDLAARDTVRLLGRLLQGVAAVPPAATAAVLLLCLVVVAVRRVELAVLLAAPLGLAWVLAAMELAPIGTGRTDAYLYPTFATAVALAADAALSGVRAGRLGAREAGRLARWRPVAAWSAAFLLAAGLVATTATSVDRRYPQQDLRPLVELVEAQARDDDGVLVYPSAVWAYALYTSWPVELVPHPTEANGFRPTFLDRRVTVLGRHVEDPDAYAPEVWRAAESSERVWFLASHWRADLEVIPSFLTDAGFVEVDRHDRPGARLTLWERPDRQDE